MGAGLKDRPSAVLLSRAARRVPATKTYLYSHRRADRSLFPGRAPTKGSAGSVESHRHTDASRQQGPICSALAARIGLRCASISRCHPSVRGRRGVSILTRPRGSGRLRAALAPPGTSLGWERVAPRRIGECGIRSASLPGGITPFERGYGFCPWPRRSVLISSKGESKHRKWEPSRGAVRLDLACFSESSAHPHYLETRLL